MNHVNPQKCRTSLRREKSVPFAIRFNGLLVLGVFLAITGCGLTSSNPVTPPEILMAGQSGTTGGLSAPYSLPISGTPSALVDVPLPAGVTLQGGVVADNTIIYLAKDGSTAGSFLLAGIPLSPGSQFSSVAIGGSSGTPVAISLIARQFLAVLESTPMYQQGCLEIFDAGALIGMTSGTISPTSSCMPLPGATPMVNGFLLPLSDGTGYLVGRVTDSGVFSTQVAVYRQTDLLNGTAASPLAPFSPLSTSYSTMEPISGAVLSSDTIVFLPHPGSASVDLYTVTSLYSMGGGTLFPMTTTQLALSTPPTLLAVDPANNFLLVASPGTVSLFGLGSVLNPPGPLGSFGTINAGVGETFGALVTYTGSS